MLHRDHPCQQKPAISQFRDEWEASWVSLRNESSREFVEFSSRAPASSLPAWMDLPASLRDGSEGRERLRRLAFNARYLSRALVKLGFITE
ncbi:serine palmitoyltransferase component, partial [Tulasnella sp. 419]